MFAEAAISKMSFHSENHRHYLDATKREMDDIFYVATYGTICLRNNLFTTYLSSNNVGSAENG